MIHNIEVNESKHQSLITLKRFHCQFQPKPVWTFCWNCCNCPKCNYHYGMTRADFIYRFKIHMNYADALATRWLRNILFWYAVLKHWACAELTQVFIEFVKSNSLQMYEMSIDPEGNMLLADGLCQQNASSGSQHHREYVLVCWLIKHCIIVLLPNFIKSIISIFFVISKIFFLNRVLKVSTLFLWIVMQRYANKPTL